MSRPKVVGPGDVLASGGASMTYKMPSSYVSPQIQEDFDSLSEGEFRAKYYISSVEYEKLKADPTGLKNLIRFNKTIGHTEEEAPATEVKVEDKRPDFEALEKQREADLAKQKVVIAEDRERALCTTAQPLGKNVLLWRIPELGSFIQLADSNKQKPLKCLVVAVAPRLSVKKGDEVLVRRHSGTELENELEGLTVIHVDDILLKL